MKVGDWECVDYYDGLVKECDADTLKGTVGYGFAREEFLIGRNATIDELRERKEYSVSLRCLGGWKELRR